MKKNVVQTFSIGSCNSAPRAVLFFFFFLSYRHRQERKDSSSVMLNLLNLKTGPGSKYDGCFFLISNNLHSVNCADHSPQIAKSLRREILLIKHIMISSNSTRITRLKAGNSGFPMFETTIDEL